MKKGKRKKQLDRKMGEEMPITRGDMKIMSGGQAGADRAALDFAIAHGIAHGGWCPKGRMAEDGPIAAHYQLMVTPIDDPIQRTEWNVRDSEATVILSIAPQLSGGSKKTAELAAKYQKPWLHLSREVEKTRVSSKLGEFLLKHRPSILNVAGPRHSEEPD